MTVEWDLPGRITHYRFDAIAAATDLVPSPPRARDDTQRCLSDPVLDFPMDGLMWGPYDRVQVVRLWSICDPSVFGEPDSRRYNGSDLLLQRVTVGYFSGRLPDDDPGANHRDSASCSDWKRPVSSMWGSTTLGWSSLWRRGGATPVARNVERPAPATTACATVVGGTSTWLVCSFTFATTPDALTVRRVASRPSASHGPRRGRGSRGRSRTTSATWPGPARSTPLGARRLRRPGARRERRLPLTPGARRGRSARCELLARAGHARRGSSRSTTSRWCGAARRPRQRVSAANVRGQWRHPSREVAPRLPGVWRWFHHPLLRLPSISPTSRDCCWFRSWAL